MENIETGRTSQPLSGAMGRFSLLDTSSYFGPFQITRSHQNRIYQYLESVELQCYYRTFKVALQTSLNLPNLAFEVQTWIHVIILEFMYPFSFSLEFTQMSVILLGVYPKELKAGTEMGVWTPMFIAALFTIVKMETTKCLLTDE